MRSLSMLAGLVITSAAASCSCSGGTAPAATYRSFDSINTLFLALHSVVRKLYADGDECQQALWHEAFALSASWESNHEALGRHTQRQADLDTYFVVPTFCEAEPCLDHRVDWAKNAFVDTVVLMAEVSFAAKIDDPVGVRGFIVEEALGNLQEIVVDSIFNDNQWTYCPTSYNPIAPWHTKRNNMTWLPQLVWEELPRRFHGILKQHNCSLPEVRLPSSDALGRPAGMACKAASALVTRTFGEAADKADDLIEAQVQSATPKILRRFQSLPAPAGTLIGLNTMLTYSRDDQFRLRVAEIFSALVGVDGTWSVSV